MQRTFEAHKIRNANAAETLHLAMYTESCFCLVLFVFFFLANNSSFCVFLDQDAILCVKELETIMLMTSVK